jgi:hypothetical protein
MHDLDALWTPHDQPEEPLPRTCRQTLATYRVERERAIEEGTAIDTSSAFWIDSTWGYRR